jgi:hypothetical protein
MQFILDVLTMVIAVQEDVSVLLPEESDVQIGFLEDNDDFAGVGLVGRGKVDWLLFH